MVSLLKSIEKWLDMRLAYFLFNGNKQQRYQQYLNNKYLESEHSDRYVHESAKYSIPVEIGI